MDIKSAKPTLAQEAGTALNQESGFFGSPPLLEQFVIRTMNDDLKKPLSQPAIEPAEIKTASPPIAPRNDSLKSAEPYKVAPIPPIQPALQATDLKTLPIAQKVPTATIPVSLLPKPANDIGEEAKKAALSAAKEKKIAQKKLEATAKESRKKLAQEQEQIKKAAEQAEREAIRAAKQKIIQVKQAQKRQLRQFLEQAKLKLSAKEFDAAITEAKKITDNEQAGWITKWRAKRLINKAQKQLQNKLNMGDAQTKIATPIIAPIAVPPIKPTMPLPSVPKPSAPTSAAAPLNLPTIDETQDKINELLFAPKTEQKPATPPIEPKPVAAPPKEFQKPATASIPLPAGITLERTTEPETTEFDIKKILLFGFGSLAVLALIISGLWYFLKQPANNVAQITQTPAPRPSVATPTPVIAPAPLFRTDSQKIFELKLGQEKANVQEAIASMGQTEEPAGSFIQILFKDADGNFPSLDKLTSSTGIDIFDLPTQLGTSTLKDQLNMNNFSFFAYSQNQEGTGSSPFNASSTNPTRLGLIIAVNSTSTDQIIKSLKDIEQLMPAGLKILLPTAENNTSLNSNFIFDQYSGINFRYIQMPDSFSGIAYAVIGNKLLIATSKDSFRSAVDRLLEK